MPNKQELLVEAEALGLEVDDNLNKDELERRINEANGGQASDDFDKGTKFYKSRIVGLFVKTGDPDFDKGEVLPRGERFTPYSQSSPDSPYEKRYGVLATSNKTAIKVLANDHNVEEIQEEDYLELTDPKNKTIKKLPY